MSLAERIARQHLNRLASDVDQAASKLQRIVKKYEKYRGDDSFSGGMYYGNVPMQTMHHGGLEVIRDTSVYDGFNRTVLLGLKIGSNWFPAPNDPAWPGNGGGPESFKARSEFYAERSKMIDKLKKEALPVLAKIKDSNTGTFIAWLSGSSWSAYYVGR